VHRLRALLRLPIRAVRLDVATLRAMLWAAAALRRTRRRLAGDGLDGAPPPAPPALPAHAVRGVGLVLAIGSASCLERAIVLQRWAGAHGAPTAVVIGVTGASGGFRAHAWLESAPDQAGGPYREILRIPAPSP
jgi:hypothetical protein